jgi:hypothetical protein
MREPTSGPTSNIATEHIRSREEQTMADVTVFHNPH